MRVARMGYTLLLGIGLLVALVGLMWVFQRKLIYLPSGGVPPVADVLPGAEEVSFETEDGLTIRGWFVPAERDGDTPTATMVVFNGNAGNRALRASLAERFRAVGLHVLLFDYRGYGGNPGQPDEAGLLHDGRAALAHARQRPEVDPTRLVLFGESLGSGAAVPLAIEQRPAAVVLRSPFTSMVDAARFHYPFLPVGTLLWDRFESIERIGELSCPLMVIAGDGDTIIPAEQSRRLYRAAPDPKRLLVVPGADHNDLEFSKGELWVDEMLDFLREQGVVG